MPSLCVFGAQWGDEGKGKIIDHLSDQADLVVRYQGGPNAGHTVVIGSETFILHLIPSGILRPGRINVIGDGMAVDPFRLLEEIDGLRQRGVAVDPECLRLSARAHLIFEHHRRIDAAKERWRGEGRIGTTGRGIGPCYADKAARTGLRLSDLLEPERRREWLLAVLAEKNAVLEKVYGEEPLDPESELERAAGVAETLRPFVTDAGAFVRQAHADGRRILFEGAQGVLLDIDAGTYPFVTSSNTGPSGLSAGASFPPNRIDRALGICKAYTTRVGAGPFPTEIEGEEGDLLQSRGDEFGATTGRRRRCGWFDAVAVRYAAEVSGADGIILTKLDVLSGFPEVRVGVAYRRGEQRWTRWPAEVPDLEGVEVEYAVRPGWTGDLGSVREWGGLPAGAREYVHWIESAVGVPVVMLSVGPERDQVIQRDDFFEPLGASSGAGLAGAGPGSPRA